MGNCFSSQKGLNNETPRVVSSSTRISQQQQSQRKPIPVSRPHSPTSNASPNIAALSETRKSSAISGTETGSDNAISYGNRTLIGTSNGSVGGSNSSVERNGISTLDPTLTEKPKQEVKILLLGSGESGKSTIIKQMKIIHQNGFSPSELIMHKPIIYKNLLQCAKSIAKALKQFGYITDTDSSGIDPKDLGQILNYSIIENKEEPANIAFDFDIIGKIISLWSNPMVHKLLDKHRSDFYLMDSAKYFFSNIERITNVHYIPTPDDILRARNTTTGIVETSFQMGGLNIHMFDVGGQRSERRKWIHCFDNVTLIIFCVALSEYDQVLLEEKTQNRLLESLVLFESIINSRWFMRTAIVLFLNKIDVFAEKLPTCPLEKYFQDYNGGSDINKAVKYILWRFTQLNRSNLAIYPHITQATDTSNIKIVFTAVQETILHNSLKESGIL